MHYYVAFVFQSIWTGLKKEIAFLEEKKNSNEKIWTTLFPFDMVTSFHYSKRLSGCV